MIYQLEAERRFPARVRIGLRAVGWVESEVQLWLAGRIESQRAVHPEAVLIEQPRHFLKRAALQFDAHVQVLATPHSTHEKMAKELTALIKKKMNW